MDVLAALGRAQIVEVLHRPSGTVAQDPLRPRRAGHGGVERQFHALLAHVVDVRAPDHVGRGLSRRIEAMVGAAHFDAVDVQRLDAPRGVRRDPPRQVDEALAAAGQAPLQALRRCAEGAAQAVQIGAAQGVLLGVQPDVVHRRAHRQRFAVAVENHAAVHRNVHHAHRTGLALALEEVAFADDQIGGTRRQASQRKQEEHQHGVVAPGALAAPAHRRTRTTCSGKRMPSCSSARRSTFW